MYKIHQNVKCLHRIITKMEFCIDEKIEYPNFQQLIDKYYLIYCTKSTRKFYSGILDRIIPHFTIVKIRLNLNFQELNSQFYFGRGHRLFFFARNDKLMLA